MAKVEITESLFNQIEKKFKKRSVEILEHLKSLESSPQKGKILGTVGGIIIKELKVEVFRFYCITDGFKLKYVGKDEIVDLLLRFVRMSDKNHQQQTIDEIKHLLRTLGPGGFE